MQVFVHETTGARKLIGGGESHAVAVPTRDMPDLELALLHQALDRLAAVSERCSGCHRTPLIGERVYVYEGGVLACELCRSVEPHPPLLTRVVHGPEFGHTLRIIDQRAAA